jgi:micrococcal nuclease
LSLAAGRGAWGSALCGVVLVLALGLQSTAAAGASKAQPGETSKRDRAAAQEESGNVEPWGVVRAVVSASRVVVVTPDGARIEVRLLGVEPPAPPRPQQQGAPAVRGQPFGREAEQYLRDLILDKQVQLETYGKDRQGRTLAVVWLGDISVNLTLVKEGLAWMSPSISVPRVRANLEVAERQAQVGKYGLWALPSPQPPWEYRKQHHLPAE